MNLQEKKQWLATFVAPTRFAEEAAKIPTSYNHKQLAEQRKREEELEQIVREKDEKFEQAVSSGEASRRKLHDSRDRFLDAMNSMRTKQANLLSDIRIQLSDERAALMEQVKNMVHGYGERAERRRFEQSMGHSVAMATIRSEKKDVEHLLSAEREKNDGLETSLERLREDNQAMEETLQCACQKLSVAEKEALIDAIGDVLIDRSEAKIQARTLEADMAIIKDNNANLEYKSDILTV